MRLGRFTLFSIAVSAVLATVAPCPTAAAQTTHVVATGHTLAKIARRYNVSVEALREANNLRVGERLRPGQRLVIPDGSPTPAHRPSKEASSDSPKDSPAKSSPEQHGPETTHLVAPGHTLARIAQRYHCTVQALQEANSLPRAAHLKPGTCLIVPLPPNARPVPERSRPCSVDSTRSASRKSFAGRPSHPGVVHIVRGSLSWSGRLVDRRGRPMPEARNHLDRIMVSDATGETRAADVRLMPLLTQISDHFAGRTLHVVSGYRPPMTNRYSEHSHHNNGEAVDFYVEGVPNEVLRDYCHTFSRVGVGYYPHSSFIHLDVRSVTTHWVDESGPGEAPVYSSVVAPELAPPPPTTPARKDPETQPDSE